MRTLAIGLLVLLLIGPAAAPVFGAGERGRPRPAGVDARVLDALGARARARVIVLLEEPGDDAGVIARLPAAEGRVLYRYPGLRSLALEVSATGLAAVVEAPGVRRVGPDVALALQLAQGVPLVKLDTLQGMGLDGSGVTVAVIDTGIDTDHPGLVGALVAERCFCSGSCCPDGSSAQSGPGSAEDGANGHGTRVAGVVVSSVPGAIGGAPGSSLVAVKTFADDGSGLLSDALMALSWILNERPDVDVVNMSFGTGLYPGHCDHDDTTSEALADAVAPLTARGTLSVAGSGNDGSGTGMIAPACIQDVVSVGAVWDADVGSRSNHGCTDPTTAADQVTCWSNASPTTDVFAPGGVTTTTTLGGGLGNGVGTSYATPMVTACAAVLRGAFPGAPVGAIASALTASPTLVTDATNGMSYPRLDCASGLEALTSRVPTLPAGPTAGAGLGLLLVLAGLRRLREGARARRGSGET